MIQKMLDKKIMRIVNKIRSVSDSLVVVSHSIIDGESVYAYLEKDEKYTYTNRDDFIVFLDTKLVEKLKK